MFDCRRGAARRAPYALVVALVVGCHDWSRLEWAGDDGRAAESDAAPHEAGVVGPLEGRCGGVGEPCCASDRCAPGGRCVDQVCAPCGGAGEGCCLAGVACNDTGFACADDVCQACGGSGQPCCEQEAPCARGRRCRDGHCRP